MPPIARLTLAAVVLTCAAISTPGQTSRHGRPAAKHAGADLDRRVVGTWEDASRGVQFLEGGGVVRYREGGARVYRSGLFKSLGRHRLRIESGRGVQTWTIVKLSADELVVAESPGCVRRYRRVKASRDAAATAAMRCEIGMRLIITAEEQFYIDHAVYKPVGPGESFVRAGILSVEPRCPAGGRYTVAFDPDGRVIVHCSVKEHDFGGHGLR
jgi:hypothetical protein